MSTKVPVHLWIVGTIGVLWNAVGAYDYLMTQTENAAYMERFTPEQLAYFYSFPTWVVACWAIAVWGGVLGCVLLLLRKRLATPVFLVSLIAMVLTTIHNFFMSNGMEVMGTAGIMFSVLIFVVAVALYLYARAMQVRGVLR